MDIVVVTVDRFGRRVLFLQDGTQMLIFQIVVGTLNIIISVTTVTARTISMMYAVVTFICFFSVGP